MSENLIKPLLYQDEAKDKDGNGPIPLEDLTLSKKVAEVLHKHYPGHAWVLQQVLIKASLLFVILHLPKSKGLLF